MTSASQSRKKPDKDVAEDGQVIPIDSAGFVHTCCGCKLTHFFAFFELDYAKGEIVLKPLKKPIALIPFRDRDATKWQRQKRNK